MKKSGTVLINPPEKTPVPEIQEVKKLDKLAKETTSIIYEVSSVFPFQLFPDKVIIDANKITVVHKGLFFKNIFPILIEDIRTVKVTRGLIFASLSFEMRGYEKNPETVSHLWPNEAGKAENYILGILNAKKEEIDLLKVPVKKLIKKLGRIGKSREKPEELF